MSNDDEPTIKAQIDIGSYNTPFYILVVIALGFVLALIVYLEMGATADAEWPSRMTLNLLYGAAASLGILLLVDASLVRRNTRFTSEHIGQQFKEKLEASGIAVHGVKQIHDGLPHELLRSHLRQMDKLIFLQTFVADMVQLEYGLKEFFERKGSARVLLLDYESPIVNIRSKEIRNVSCSLFRESIISNIGSFLDMGEENVEVRLYDSIPSVSIYGDKSTFFVGNYLRDHHAVQGPILEVRDGFYMKKLSDHFESIWASSKILDIKAFDDLRKGNEK